MNYCDTNYLSKEDGVPRAYEPHSASNYGCPCKLDCEVDAKITSFDRSHRFGPMSASWKLEPTTPSGDKRSLALCRSPAVSHEFRFNFNSGLNGEAFRVMAEAAVANSLRANIRLICTLLQRAKRKTRP
ncbi:hypothetical protein CLF_101374 [Clonorchis sinensis]|uniref:Uncharacterized protein n=1 Tax=Clonorchis sinensis TaxID=79923 RepID=G7Y5L8_CLOSI|nr:hypothetical protein CLF_101374 [Clonorchis sinensis]